MSTFHVVAFVLFCLAMLALLALLIFDNPVEPDDDTWADGDTTNYLRDE